MSLEGLTAALGQGDMFLVVFFLQHQWGKLILFYMPSHALLSDSLRQAWLKTSLRRKHYDE